MKTYHVLSAIRERDEWPLSVLVSAEEYSGIPHEYFVMNDVRDGTVQEDGTINVTGPMASRIDDVYCGQTPD